MDKNRLIECKREMLSCVPKKNFNFLGEVLYRPSNTILVNKKENEEIFLLVRSDWIVNMPWILKSIFYLLLPIIIYFLFPVFLNLLNYNITINVPISIIFGFVLFYYSIMFTYIFIHIIDWYYDIFIVTNDRIIDIDFSPWYGYSIKEAPLVNIQDIQETSKGFFAVIFDYGDIIAKTSSDNGVLNLEKIPQVHKVRTILHNLVSIAKKYYDIK